MTMSRETKEILPAEVSNRYHPLDPTLSRLPAVLRRTRLSRSSIYTMVARGEFPAPIKIGSRSVAWLDHEITTWITSRASAVTRRRDDQSLLQHIDGTKERRRNHTGSS